MLPFEKSAMVWGITGSLGSGKSLVAVANLVQQLIIGSCFVITNIRLNTKLLSEQVGFDITPFIEYIDLTKDDIDYQNDFPRGSLRGRAQKKRVVCVFDEMAEFFDQYENAKSDRLKNFLSWLRHSSKLGQDVLLIIQNPAFLQKSIRLLVHRWVFCCNLSQYRIPFFHIPLFPNFSMTKVVDKFGSVVRGGFGLYWQPKWGRYYDTAQTISSTVTQEETRTFEEYKTKFDFASLNQKIAFLKTILFGAVLWKLF